MLILSDTDVQRCLSLAEAISLSKVALLAAATHDSIANVPSRIAIAPRDSANNDTTLFKPAQVDQSLGLKVVSVRSGNQAPLPTVLGVVMLLDTVTGVPTVLMNATYLTALRTAASSALATQLFSSPTATHLLVFGAGLQAKLHVHCIRIIRPSITRITIVNRSIQNAEKLRQELRRSDDSSGVDYQVTAMTDIAAVRHAVSSADIICCTTNSSKPVLLGEWLPSDGRQVHINAIGAFTPTMQEVDSRVVEMAAHNNALTIDTPSAITTCGDLGTPIMSELISAEDCVQLGALLSLTDADADAAAASQGGLSAASVGLLKTHHPRLPPASTGVSFFKSVGTAVLDMVTAHAIYERAKQQSVGTTAAV